MPSFRRLLEAFSENDPHPLPRLPKATGGHWHRLPTGLLLPSIPTRPRTPLPLAQARARAARLWAPRLRLERPVLHRGHAHHDLELDLAIRSYVIAGTALPQPSSAWERWVASRVVAALAPNIKEHEWSKQHRLNDIRRLIGIEAKGPAEWRRGR